MRRIATSLLALPLAVAGLLVNGSPAAAADPKPREHACAKFVMHTPFRPKPILVTGTIRWTLTGQSGNDKATISVKLTPPKKEKVSISTQVVELDNEHKWRGKSKGVATENGVVTKKTWTHTNLRSQDMLQLGTGDNDDRILDGRYTRPNNLDPNKDGKLGAYFMHPNVAWPHHYYSC